MKFDPRKCSPRDRRAEELAERIANAPVPTVGFCDCCETFVDEPAGKLHRETCFEVPVERRRARA